jgi:hypothetical protein
MAQEHYSTPVPANADNEKYPKQKPQLPTTPTTSWAKYQYWRLLRFKTKCLQPLSPQK